MTEKKIKNQKVSVIMSVYNAEKYLKYSIESILNQTYKNIEFIIINDGSTDDSLSIIKDYQKIDNRIILINRKNKGLIYSLNEGVRLSTGDYIARMDADDISMENKIEKELNYLENENAYLCGSWVVKINEEGNEIGKYNYPPKTWFKNRIFLLKGNSFIHPTTIFKREILNDKSIYKNGILYRNYKYIEDYELWTRVSNKYKSINISEYLLKYRIHNSQETIKLKSIKIKLHIRFLALWRLIKNIF